MSSGDRPGLILQHGDAGPPGILGQWLLERSIAHQIHAAWLEPPPADPAAYGWIVSLGSEHTPGSPGAPEWVQDEVGFLERALERNVPVLGLCFGGQALAAAAGATVGPADPPEIGWFEVASDDPGLVPAGPWLHYHYDQFEPPPGATIIARSPAGPAAFTLGASLGLQFHPESTPEIAAEWARQDGERLTLTAGIDPLELEDQGVRAAPAAAIAARKLFDGWWQRLAR
jgi:GMP synthase-like glutamine amidotransferase